jgi:2,4-dienoyl-CoA reductase-like NADH-dependent reductase (Old Yellow Enzyme family)
VENRAGVLRLIRAAVAERAGADYACTVKVPAEVAPFGPRATVDDALAMCRLVENWGFDAVTPVEVSVFPDTTLSRGDAPDSFRTNKAMASRLERAAPSRMRRATLKAGLWWGGKHAPFTPVWNRDLFTAAAKQVDIPVFAVGGIRTADDVRACLDDGAAMVGIGRPFYAEPDLPARILANDAEPRLCRNSNKCVPAQMLGMRGACYNPEVNKAAKQRTSR